MEIRRNAVPWPLKGCVAVREKAMYAARGGLAPYGRTGVRTSGASEWDAEEAKEAGSAGGLAGVRAADARRSSSCVTDGSWTGANKIARRVAREKR
jgi:hypothetical protein